jgi:undecaprenyl diphosphate synthase
LTKNNTGLTLVLALSYSGRWDITGGMKRIAEQVKSGKLDPEKITDEVISKNLATKDIPDPDLLIRTSGELRLSNFLLWQLAYSEIYVTDVLWPDFRRQELYNAIESYQSRERRFGKVSEQLKTSSNPPSKNYVRRLLKSVSGI